MIIIFERLLRSSPLINCDIAECSLSTGINLTPFAFDIFFIIGPAATILSLFARARFAPVSRAFKPGRKPAEPTIADITHSACLLATSNRPFIPAQTSILCPLSMSFRSLNLLSLAVATTSALNLIALPAKSSILFSPVKPTTLNLSLSLEIKSKVFWPIDPVAPKILIFFTNRSIQR